MKKYFEYYRSMGKFAPLLVCTYKANSKEEVLEHIMKQEKANTSDGINIFETFEDSIKTKNVIEI